jgi:hypothetical protein
MHGKRSAFEFYEKVYDDLTQAVKRAKWICRQKDLTPRTNLHSLNSRKRGRPLGSKKVKPGVKENKHSGQTSNGERSTGSMFSETASGEIVDPLTETKQVVASLDANNEHQQVSVFFCFSEIIKLSNTSMIL